MSSRLRGQESEYTERLDRGVATGYVGTPSEREEHGYRTVRVVELTVSHLAYRKALTAELELITRYVRDGKLSGREGTIYIGGEQKSSRRLHAEPAARFSRRAAEQLHQRMTEWFESSDEARDTRLWAEEWLLGGEDR